MQTYRFGDFDLDLNAQQLRRRGKPVHLERRPFELLTLLVRHHGTMVSRDDIIAALWSDRVIIDFESGLNTLVRKVRHALGDSAEAPTYIETVPGRGYRFIATVAASEEQQPVATPPASTKAGRWPRPLYAIAAILLAVGAAALGWQAWFSEAGPMRIAVLPFENLAGDATLEHLGSGLAEETSLSLAQIDLTNLRLIGGVSTRAISDSALPVQQAGRELGADFVVQSALRREGNKIRVTSHLIRVADSEQVWSASFDRELTELLGLQRELAVAIAEQVRQRLSPDVAAAIDRRQTPNPAAYERYLKGRLLWSQLSPFAVREGMQYFEQAAREDPGYALAWAGISQVSSTSLMVADAEPVVAVPRARDALRRALEIDPGLAEVQYAKGYIHLFIDWDMPAAAAAARRAASLDPNSATAHMLLGMALATMGQLVEARATLRRARELDPFFALVWANSANVALQSADPQSALAFSRQAVAIDPENWVAHFHLGNSLSRLGELETAIAAYADAERFSDANSKAVAARTYVLTQLGRIVEAREILKELAKRAETQYVPPYAFAVIHAAIGETEPALAALARAIDRHDVHLIGISGDRRLQSLHAHPRFQLLVSQVEEMRGAGHVR